MKTMSELVDEGIVPQSLAKHLLWDCKDFCNFPILYNNNLTSRKCSNPYCSGHLGARASKMFKMLNIGGIGTITASKLIQRYNLYTHFQLLDRSIYGDFPIDSAETTLISFIKNKPSLALHDLVKYTYIPGLQDGTFNIMNQYSDIDDFIANGKPYNLNNVTWALLLTKRDEIKYAQTLFNVSMPLSSQIFEIMVTGSVAGYSNREDFVPYLNITYGSYVQFKKVGKKLSADILILDFQPQRVSGKLAKAMSSNSKTVILSSTNLIERIEKYIRTGEHILIGGG